MAFPWDGGRYLIYFIDCPAHSIIKIGYTNLDPARRLRDLSAASPAPLVSMATMAGDREAERVIHSRFLSLWSHGEWFRRAPELVAFIEAEGDPWDCVPVVHVAAPATLWSYGIPGSRPGPFMVRGRS